MVERQKEKRGFTMNFPNIFGKDEQSNLTNLFGKDKRDEARIAGLFSEAPKQQERVIPKPLENDVLTKFITIGDFSQKVEESLANAVQRNHDSITIPIESFEFLLNELTRLKDADKTAKIKDEELKNYQRENKELTDKLEFERFSLERLQQQFSNEISMENERAMLKEKQIEEKTQEIASLESRISELMDTIDHHKQEISSLKSTIASKERDNQDLLIKIDNIQFELNKYHKIIGAMNKIADSEEFSQQKDFSYIVTSEVGPLIFDFLDVEDILTLRLTSGFYAKAIKNIGSYGILIGKKLQQRFGKKKKELLYQIDYFNRVVNDINEDYGRNAFAKFVWWRETAGEYMPGVLANAESLIKTDSQIEKEDEEIKKAYEEKERVAELMKKQAATQADPLSKISSFFKSKVTEKKAPQESKFSRSEAINMKAAMMQRTNPHYVFLKAESGPPQKDDKQKLLAKAKSLVGEYMNNFLAKRYLFEEADWQQFIALSVSQLIIFSKFLLQEAKEMEVVKDILLAKLDQQKNSVIQMENTIEDYKERLNAEKKMKQFYYEKYAELEGQMHQADASLLRSDENVQKLTASLNAALQEKEELKKAMIQNENKLKVVVKEVKALRAKNKELEEKSEMVFSNFMEMKSAFQSLNLPEYF